MTGWLRKLIANFGFAPQVAKTADVDQRDRHSAELHRHAQRVENDLRSVRRIEIIVRRR